MANLKNEQYLRQVVDKIFNNWTGLRLAVEHGMGGRNGQKNAIDFMNYVYEYCLCNDNVTIEELQDILEEVMDQEFSTMCEDNSIFEISTTIAKFLQLLKQQKYDEIENEIGRMSENAHWLRHDIQIKQNPQTDSSSSSGSESDMEVDITEPSTNNQTKGQKHNNSEDGWTTVTYKK